MKLDEALKLTKELYEASKAHIAKVSVNFHGEDYELEIPDLEAYDSFEIAKLRELLLKYPKLDWRFDYKSLILY